MIRKLANENLDNVSGGEIFHNGNAFQLPANASSDLICGLMPRGHEFLVQEESTGYIIDANGNRYDATQYPNNHGELHPAWHFIQPYTYEKAEKLDRLYNPHRYQ